MKVAASETGSTNSPTVMIPSRVIDQRPPITHHAANHPQGRLVAVEGFVTGQASRPNDSADDYLATWAVSAESAFRARVEASVSQSTSSADLTVGAYFCEWRRNAIGASCSGTAGRTDAFCA